MADVTQADLQALGERLGEVEGYLHIDMSRRLVEDLEQRSAEPGFWDDADEARATMERLSRAKEDVRGIDDAHARLEDATTALELGLEMGDADLLGEASSLAEALEAQLSELELSSWFTGEFDHGDAIVSVKPGQG